MREKQAPERPKNVHKSVAMSWTNKVRANSPKAVNPPAKKP